MALPDRNLLMKPCRAMIPGAAAAFEADCMPVLHHPPLYAELSL